MSPRRNRTATARGGYADTNGSSRRRNATRILCWRKPRKACPASCSRAFLPTGTNSYPGCQLSGRRECRCFRSDLRNDLLQGRQLFGGFAIDRSRRQGADEKEEKECENQSSHLSRVRCCIPGSAQSLAWLPFCQACRLQSQSSKSLTILPGVPDPPVRYFFQS